MESVITYASDGEHSAKTWGRIIANKFIYVDASAKPDIIHKGTKEKNRVASVLSSIVPKIKGKEKKSGSQWANIIVDALIKTAPDKKLKKQYEDQRDTMVVHLKSYVKTMFEEIA